MKIKCSGLFLILLLSFTAHAYPDFIGYGYSTCITCHFNGAGGGALSDYGRGLFASEIAANPFNITDEQAAAISGFLGSKELPYWFRPGFKYRGLYLEQNPRGSNSSSRFITMQTDLNTAISLDPDQKNLIMLTGGTTVRYHGSDKRNEFVSHEYYYRRQLTDSSWVYLGLMDIVFGIRTPDHTAYSRTFPVIGQNDQVESILYHTATDDRDLFLQIFSANPSVDDDEKRNGYSLMYEKNIAEKTRVGLSMMRENYSTFSQNLLSAHTRVGVGLGSSVMMELGASQKTQPTLPNQTGAFALFEGMIRLQRGLNFTSIGEYSKAALDASTIEKFRWRFGLLYFPMQRLEWRNELMQVRSLSPTDVVDDSWMFQSQVHVSL